MSFFSDWSASFKINREKFNGSWAAKLTAIWLLLVVGSSAVNWQSFCDMGPNEWGDFLAGTMSPVAFMWLVFGYLQQGRELKQNTEALHLQQQALLLQHEELAEQVKATLKVAAHSEQQAIASISMVQLTERERRSRELAELMSTQPKFTFAIIAPNSGWEIALRIRNVGLPAHDIEVHSGDFSETAVSSRALIDTDKYCTLSFLGAESESVRKDFEIGIEYTDANGIRRIQTFRIKNFRASPPTLEAVED